MNQMLAIYTVQWEMRAREEVERQTGSRDHWLARALCRATLPRPRKDRSLTERSTLKRLVNALGYTY
jgi:hypothetical protein